MGRSRKVEEEGCTHLEPSGAVARLQCTEDVEKPGDVVRSRSSVEPTDKADALIQREH